MGGKVVLHAIAVNYPYIFHDTGDRYALFYSVFAFIESDKSYKTPAAFPPAGIYVISKY